MSSQNPKRQLFSHFAALARVLGNEHRLEILELLAQGERPVEILVERLGLPFANVSQHLQQLRKAGLVVGRREGKRIVYRMQDGPVLDAVAALRRLAEHNLAAVKDLVDTYYTAIDELEPIGRDELLERLDSGSVTLIDVRPADEFEAGHIPGAVNMRIEEMEQHLAAVPQTSEIVAYCRGPYCTMSFEAVRALRALGYAARRLEDGFPEWKGFGLPVET